MLTPRRALATALVSDSMVVAAGGIAGVASDYSDGTPLDVVSFDVDSSAVVWGSLQIFSNICAWHDMLK